MSSNEAPLFGLTDSDVRVALCALKVVLADGNLKVEKAHLAKLTGHDNPDSALRVWYVAKAKLTKGGSSSESATSGGTPTKGRKKTAAKTRTPTPKKRAKEQSEDEEAEDEEVEKPPTKRVKKEAPEDTGVGVQDEL